MISGILGALPINPKLKRKKKCFCVLFCFAFGPCVWKINELVRCLDRIRKTEQLKKHKRHAKYFNFEEKTFTIKCCPEESDLLMKSPIVEDKKKHWNQQMSVWVTKIHTRKQPPTKRPNSRPTATRKRKQNSTNETRKQTWHQEAAR